METCQHTDIEVIYHNFGYDIWPGGEEKQHLEQCKTCGAERLKCDVFEWGKPPYVSYGKWFTDGFF